MKAEMLNLQELSGFWPPGQCAQSCKVLKYEQVRAYLVVGSTLNCSQLVTHKCYGVASRHCPSPKFNAESEFLCSRPIRNRSGAETWSPSLLPWSPKVRCLHHHACVHHHHVKTWWSTTVVECHCYCACYNMPHSLGQPHLPSMQASTLGFCTPL